MFPATMPWPMTLEPTRCSAVPSPLPPNHDKVPVPSSFGVAPPTATAVVGGRHCSLVIVPFLGTFAVIFLVLLLPPERTPIPDRETHPRRATYDNNGSLALIHAHGQSSLLALFQGRSVLIHPLPLSASQRLEGRKLRHVRCLLKVVTSILPSFYALINFFPVGIAMIVWPRRQHLGSPHPWPILILSGGTL
jgi:hypothetical protein